MQARAADIATAQAPRKLWRLKPRAAPTSAVDYAMRWRQIKTHFSRRQLGGEPRSTSRRSKNERGIWQRRYWEDAVRDDADLNAHTDYIHFNPVKHGLVARARDWRWSSFHRYVRDEKLPLD